MLHVSCHHAFSTLQQTNGQTNSIRGLMGMLRRQLSSIESGNSSQARVVLRCWGFPGPDWAWWIIVYSREANSFYYFHPKETTFYFSISISLYIGHFHKFVFPLLAGLCWRAAQQHRCTELFNKPQDRRNNISREARDQNVSWWKIRLLHIFTLSPTHT